MKRLLVLAACVGASYCVVAQHDESPAHVQGQSSAHRRAQRSGAGHRAGLAPHNTVRPVARRLHAGRHRDVYYLSGEQDDQQGNAPATYVFRLNPATGAVLAQSPNLGGRVGTYGGVAVGKTRWLSPSSRPAPIRITASLCCTSRRSPCCAISVAPHSRRCAARRTSVTCSMPTDIATSTSTTGLPVNWMRSTPQRAKCSGAPVLAGERHPRTIRPVWVANGKQVLAIFGLAPERLRRPGQWRPDVHDPLATPARRRPTGAQRRPERRWHTHLRDDDERLRGRRALGTAQDDGSVIWSVPSVPGSQLELSFTSRPAVIGNRIYCGGQNGVVACFEDLGSTFVQRWNTATGTAITRVRLRCATSPHRRCMSTPPNRYRPARRW